jgi:hypothetical protein
MGFCKRAYTVCFYYVCLILYYKYIVLFFSPTLLTENDGLLETQALSTVSVEKYAYDHNQHNSLELQNSQNRAIAVVIWDSYHILPALVLFRSLRSYGTKLDLLILSPTRWISSEKLQAFETLGVTIKHFEHALPKIWSRQFFKLYAWNLVKYNRILLLDADTLAVTNVDDVFNMCDDTSDNGNIKKIDKICGIKNPSMKPSSIMEAKMWDTRNYINGGMILLSPNLDLFHDMIKHVNISGMCCKFAFEQDFLNWYFSFKGDESKELYVLPLGRHYNNYPATHLIHYCHGGKPWYW